jgi:hypothetical protein
MVKFAHRLFLKQGVDRIQDDGRRRRHFTRRPTFTDSSTGELKHNVVALAKAAKR